MKGKLGKINTAQLIEPSIEYKNEYIEAATEFLREEGADAGFKVSMPDGDFEEFLTKLRRKEGRKNLPEGWVPQSELWLVDGKNFIGWAKVRHGLNDALLLKGGHIGYGIRPSMRSKGYGKRILELALAKAKSLGLKRVLLTCDDNNLNSARIIESNGGVFENKINHEGRLTRRYWIEVK